MALQLDATSGAQPAQIGARYRVDALLGRGGMATVYRVTDGATERSVALKQLAMPREPSRRSEMVALFEREFHALAQLSHPQVIEVYDYGVDETGPYYTMELLDGGDLRSRAPLPWREACSLLCGVASSLALIDSRRLVHRDVSPANIWCTREGEGKLIDFGALAPMGQATSIVGTPAFVAPEVVQRSALDGRTDLFSFGATLYFALTGRPPYPARNFSELAELWTLAVPAPSALVDDVPAALDALVMSLLCPEPVMRPRTAFEVMQRLSAIAGIESAEPLSVSQAYLSTPLLVGRDREVAALRDADGVGLRGSRPGGSAGGRVGRRSLAAPRGMRGRGQDARGYHGGRQRERRAHGRVRGRADARRAAARDAPGRRARERARGGRSRGALRSAARRTGHRRRRAPPEAPGLRQTDVPGLRRQKALSDWILHISETNRLAIAIDDAHEIDEPSRRSSRSWRARLEAIASWWR